MIAVRWTETSVAEIISIKAYIGRDSRLLRHTVVARLYGAVEQIASFPLSGREVLERIDPSLWELVRPPYRIVYEVVGGLGWTMAPRATDPPDLAHHALTAAAFVAPCCH